MSHNSITGFIVDAFSFSKSKLHIVVRTLTDIKAVVTIVDFTPSFIVNNNPTNYIKIANAVYENKAKNVVINDKKLQINPFEIESMLVCEFNNKYDMINTYKNLLLNDVIVYNCEKNIEHQFFNQYHIDPAKIVKIEYMTMTNKNGVYIYEARSACVTNIENDESLMNKIPLRVLGFDIEVETDGNTFPDASNLNDRVLAISFVEFSTHQEREITSIYYISNKSEINTDKLVRRNVSACKRFDTEQQMLVSFIYKVLKCDILFDFNGTGFDVPYIMKRLDMFNVKPLELFPISIMCTEHNISFYGLIHIDLLKIFKGRDADKNKENNLNYLCMKYLRQEILEISEYRDKFRIKKMMCNVGMSFDITTETIDEICRDNFNGEITGIESVDNFIWISCDPPLPVHTRVGFSISLVKDNFNIHHLKQQFEKALLYCINDTRLTHSLFNTQNYFQLYIQKSRIRSCLLRDSATRGNSWLNQMMITRAMVMSDWTVKLNPTSSEGSYVDDKYTGAEVIAPVPGRHCKVAVLDFNSLYPSIIITHNICPTTYVSAQLKKKLNIPEDNLYCMNIEGEDVFFVKSNIRQGLVPRFCEMFIESRKTVKKYLDSNILSENERMILNLKQINLKVSNNSIYGSIGDSKSVHFNKYVASSIPYMGRYYLNDLKHYFESLGHSVVGGDTDSVFLKVTCDQQKFETQLDAFNDKLKRPMKIEQEKVYDILYLSSKKKRRFGKLRDKIEVKGYMSVKRDTPMVFRKLEQRIFKALLDEPDHETALTNAVLETRLLEQSFNNLSITKTLKAQQEYTDTNVAHISLARKLVDMGILQGIDAGDKITYVYVTNAKSSYIKDRIATEELMSREKMRIDYDKYINDMASMLKQILDEIISQDFLDRLLKIIINK